MKTIKENINIKKKDKLRELVWIGENKYEIIITKKVIKDKKRDVSSIK